MTRADDHLAVLRAVAEYCRCCDDGRFGDFALLFAPDARLVVRGAETHGRDAITASIAAMQTPERRGRHVVANSVVDLDADRASVESDFVFFRYVDGTLQPVNHGRYLDELVRDGDDWVFARREIVLVEGPSPVPATEDA